MSAGKLTLIGLALLGMLLLVIAAVLLPPGFLNRESPSRFAKDLVEPSSGEGGVIATNSPLLVEEPAPTPNGMVWIPGGTFLMGNSAEPPAGNPDHCKPDEFPPHEVELDGFWMDETPVTNRQFEQFVAMTGHVTFAEMVPTREDFAKSGVDVHLIQDKDLVPGSMCFNCEFNRQQLVTGVPNWEYQVWQVVQGANWRHPDGPESSITDRMDHPVVHVNWDDAVAYCRWAGKRLPTEAEFEYAARGGLPNAKYPWGDELHPAGKELCNFWQGTFPTERLVLDGFETTSFVKAFPPNGYSLYDMAGNVWEWCSDYYRPDYYAHSPRRNPQGPSSSFDANEPGIVKRVQRGGSFLCNTNSCTGYRVAARMRGEVTSSSFHNGFRCVVDARRVDEHRAAQERIAAWRGGQPTDVTP
jgi:formylglycine-generating enzyme required for sulfatase activity